MLKPLISRILKIKTIAKETRDSKLRELVDIGADLHALCKLAKSVDKEIGTRFKATGVGAFAGENFIATITSSERETLDTDAVKREMGEVWYKERCRSTPVLTLTYTPKEIPPKPKGRLSNPPRRAMT